MANSLDGVGGASVWSADAQKAREVATRLQAGTVWINKHGAVDPRVPFAVLNPPVTAWSLVLRVEGLAYPQAINT